jgi:hypothetical protein
MFCPKCGTENPDDNKHCKECGAALINSSLPTNPKNQYSPDPFLIGAGAVILVTMYFMPIVPISGNSTITLAHSVSLCGDPFSAMLYGCSKSSLSWIFYGGWVLAIICIVIGLFDQSEE